MTTLRDLEGGAVQWRSAVVEDIDTEKRELLVRAAPYLDEYTDIGGGIWERFLPKTFAKASAAPSRLTVLDNHGGPVVGRGIEVEDKPDGVWVRARLGRTRAADDVIANIEDHISEDVSVEFRPLPGWMDMEPYRDGMRVTHRRAHLNGFAIVPEGAYGRDAFVAELVRDDERDRRIEQERLWLQEYRRRNLLTG